MRANLAALASGLLFGAGLSVSGMVDPLRVLGFLDVAGAWDATLAFVMGGAVLVAAPAFWLARRRHAPVLAPEFNLPSAARVDRRLIVGATLFGIGWGIAGYCPGPALAGIAAMWHELVWFIPAYALGAALVRP
ncbi:MAG: DUF6691 family protein [Gammaproteobacteria bacterium]